MPAPARSPLRPAPPPAARIINLLDADPELGSLLADDRMQAARRQLVAREHIVPTGEWRDTRLQRSGAEHLGVLVIDGVVARELLFEDNVSTELLGPGDLLRPWQDHGPAQLLRAGVRWTVLEPLRCAVLDRAFASRAAAFSEIHAVLLNRATERAGRLAMTQAISQLNGVDQRIHALLWHLAERWGRVTPRGTVVPLVLPHRLIAQLIGARRPTVSTALGVLMHTGAIQRLPDGTWLLTGEPTGTPDAETRRFIRMRRPRVSEHAEARSVLR